MLALSGLVILCCWGPLIKLTGRSCPCLSGAAGGNGEEGLRRRKLAAQEVPALGQVTRAHPERRWVEC